MADRALLHRNQLEAFKDWLIEDGWTIEPLPTKPDLFDFRVLMARKVGRQHPLMVYDRNSGAHYSLLDRDSGIVRAFIRSKRDY